ncbi:MAG TPA: hypothetical protein VIJ42_07615 [Stellaceae bacterium]
MYEAQYRADAIQAIQDGAARVATRGDLVALNYVVLSRLQKAARVKSVRGALVEIDDSVTMAFGGSYVVQFRHYADSADQVGTSILRTVATVVGEVSALRLTGSGPAPDIGAIVMFGPAGQQSLLCFVQSVEATDGMAFNLHLIAAAPEIDTLTDAEVPPAWNGRVGTEIGLTDVAPAVPIFISVATGTGATGTETGLLITLKPGAGAPVAAYQIDTKIDADLTWTTLVVNGAEASALISSYAVGDIIDVRARTVSFGGTASGNTATVAVTIGDFTIGDAGFEFSTSPFMALLFNGATISLGDIANPPEAVFECGDIDGAIDAVLELGTL